MGEMVASFILTIFIYIFSLIAYRRGWQLEKGMDILAIFMKTAAHNLSTLRLINQILTFS